MKVIRKRIAAVLVVLALGGLGGYAMSTNPAAHQKAPVVAQLASQNGQSTSPVTTGASGAVSATPVSTQSGSVVLPGSVAPKAKQDD